LKHVLSFSILRSLFQQERLSCFDARFP
jgi:hypothetical protein